jgi:hypothetical protein
MRMYAQLLFDVDAMLQINGEIMTPIPLSPSFS